MISKAKIKLIQSLKLKKYREKYGLFVAEGSKIVQDLLYEGFVPENIFVSNDFAEKQQFTHDKIVFSDEKELNRISFLNTSSDVLAVFHSPERRIHTIDFSEDLMIVIDSVRDPGNLGTIIRTADWFGIRQIICSHGTVDVYNPKVVQATMGSIGRLKIFYDDLNVFLKKAKAKRYNILGSFMEGVSVYDSDFSAKKILIMGNEGKGISKEIERFVDNRISIPVYFNKGYGPESLNVAIATAIIVSEMKREKW